MSLMSYRKAFTFDNQSSMDLGLYISGHKTFNGPEMNIEKVSIPGRNGDLFISGGTYKNVTYAYDAFIENVTDNADFENKAMLVRSWLLSKVGYKRLEDEYHPDEFRLALFKGPVNFNVIYFRAATTTITFDCKPQRFLKTGETAKTCSANKTTTISNPTPFETKPLIQVTAGTGTFTMNGTRIQVKETGIYIDCESEQAYSGTTFKNDKIVLTDNKFPKLSAGNNSVVTPSGMTLKVTPRWYIL